MPIQIESLPWEYSSRSVCPPEANPFMLSSHDLFQEFYSAPDKIGQLYGGTAATVAAPTPMPLYRSPSSGIPPVSNWSVALQTMLDRPPPALPNRLVASGVVFCAAFATWATVGQLDEVGQARGRLVPQGEPYKVHPVVSGKISNVYVREGQSVKAGQVVAQLDNEIALNRIEWLHQEHASYEKELLQTDLLIDKARLEAQARVAIANAEVQAQEAAIAQAQAKISGQDTAIAQTEMQAATRQTLLNQLQRDAAAQEERMARLEYLVNEGALARDQLFQAQQTLSDRQRSITQQAGEIQLAVAESQRSQTDLQQVLAEFDRLQAQLTQRYAAVHETQLQSQQSMQQILMQKTQLQAKVQQNQKQLQQARTELEQLLLRAPVDGTVLALNVPNKGEVVQSGQTIAEMAPHSAPLILVAALPTREAGFVKVGDSTQIKFDAYPYQDYGIVSGKVTAISPDIKPDERLGAVYRVEIAIDRHAMSTSDRTVLMQAGQTATAEIVTRRRRIAEILLDPIRKLQKSSLSL